MNNFIKELRDAKRKLLSFREQIPADLKEINEKIKEIDTDMELLEEIDDANEAFDKGYYRWTNSKGVAHKKQKITLDFTKTHLGGKNTVEVFVKNVRTKIPLRLSFEDKTNSPEAMTIHTPTILLPNETKKISIEYKPKFNSQDTLKGKLQVGFKPMYTEELLKFANDQGKTR